MKRHEGDVWDLHADGAWLAVPCGLDGSFGRGLGQQAMERYLPWTAEAEAAIRGGSRLFVSPEVRLIAAPVRTQHGVHAARGLVTETIGLIRARRDEFKPRFVLPLLGVGSGDYKAARIVPLIERAFYDCPWAVLCFPEKRGFQVA